MNINLTLLGQSIAFAMFVWFCIKYVWPPLITALEERRDKIATGLSNAEKAQLELATAQQQSQEKLEEARNQAATVLDQANRRATQIIEEAKSAAREEGERLKSKAQSEIEQEASQVRESLRSELGALVYAGIDKILGSSLKSKHNDNIIKELEDQWQASGDTDG